MSTVNQPTKGKASFCQEIEEKSHQPISSCYHCMKCAGGCPINFVMEHNNYEILRMIQLGEKDKVFKSNTPWLCVGCKTCAVRCPNGIDTSKVMDTIKMETIAEDKIPASHYNIKLFYELFLDSMKGFPIIGGEGRGYEVGLMGLYKFCTGDFLADMDLGKEMTKRGKMPFLPHNALKRRKGEIKKIFQRAKEKKAP